MANDVHFLAFLIQIFISNAEGSKLTLTSSLPTIQPLLTPELILRCSLEDTSASSSSVIGRSISNNLYDTAMSVNQKLQRRASSTMDNAMFVLSMFMYRNNEDIASMSVNVPARAVTTSSNLSVRGRIPGEKEEKAFLEVNITYPTDSQVGNYSCSVTALDEIGHTVVYSQSTDIVIASPAIEDLVSHVHDLKIKDLNKSAEIALLKTDLDDSKMEVSSNKAEIASLQNALGESKMEVSSNKAKIDSLENALDSSKREVSSNKAKIATLENALDSSKMEVSSNKAKIASLESALEEKTHIEGNTIHFGNIGGGYHGPASRSYHVSFRKAYNRAPMVHIAVMEGGSNKDFHSEFNVQLIGVNTKGFTVYASMLHSSSSYWLDHLTLSWLSVPN